MLRKDEKHRRMEVRREIGNRQVEANSQSFMHPSYPYLGAHACLVVKKALS